MEESDFLPKECDVIMEGGVTSGVVFSSFIAGLARRFDLRNIGGTSVGAVAAVAAAAAQFKRNHERSQPVVDELAKESGYVRLAGLPLWLQEQSTLGHSNLFSLFQPCRDLAPHFEVLQAMLNKKRILSRIRIVIVSVLRNFMLGAIAGILIIAAIHAVQISFRGGALPGSPAGWLAALAWFVVEALLAAIVLAFLEAGLRALRGLRLNRFGICSGFNRAAETDPSLVPALTQWLHSLVQEIAGLPNQTPLTFGLLKASQRSIELAFITTGISEMRSQRLPSTGKDLMFRLSDLHKLFPDSIVDWMKSHSRPLEGVRNATRQMLAAADPGIDSPERDLYFLPAADDWPVVFAARLSLSFPILLQAIPLYRLRYVVGDGIALGDVAIKRVWFSDGGLTSNFPIHFFDSLLPSRPTFGVTLDATLAEGAPPSARVHLPTNNSQGMVNEYVDLDGPDGVPSLGAFASALLRTMRRWRDEALKRTPGFRDRIVQIRHTKYEGGLNLNMPLEAIQVMSASGTLAAEAIIDRFLDPIPEQNGWLNHRWVRVRSAAGVLQQKIKPLAAAWTGSTSEPSYAAMWDGTVPMPDGYAHSTEQRDCGKSFWESIASAGAVCGDVDLSKNGPAPQPTLEISPKQS